MTDAEREELEFALREYKVAAEYLMEVLAKHETVPGVIGGALILLSKAIDSSWQEV
jgi:hypothetical protein